MRWFYPAR